MLIDFDKPKHSSRQSHGVFQGAALFPPLAEKNPRPTSFSWMPRERELWSDLDNDLAELGRLDVIVEHVGRLVELVELVTAVGALGQQEVLLAASRPEQVGHYAVGETVHRVCDSCGDFPVS